jgi:hypothetical protein
MQAARCAARGSAAIGEGHVAASLPASPPEEPLEELVLPPLELLLDELPPLDEPLEELVLPPPELLLDELAPLDEPLEDMLASPAPESEPTLPALPELPQALSAAEPNKSAKTYSCEAFIVWRILWWCALLCP